MDGEFEILTSDTLPLEHGRYPGFNPGLVEDEHFVLHRDVEVPLSDGAKMYVDIFMPRDASGPVPAIIGWSPYGKHGFKHLGLMPGAGVSPAWISKYTIWEGPDPAFWCPEGYAIVSPDPRGSWKSDGDLTFFSPQEAQDGHEVIEWLAEQSWCNQRIGMLGVSYLAMSQWSIAATRPPHLAAICPWEGVSSLYHELHFHGGIPEKSFATWWREKSRFSERPTEDFTLMQAAHPMYDDYWASKAAEIERVDVPAFVVASWSDNGLHTRGTLEAFKRISSPQKWLLVHGDKKWKHFHDPVNVNRQKKFFDQFLKGEDAGVLEWPKVEYELRLSGKEHVVKTADAWPLPRTRYEALFLDASSGTMDPHYPAQSAERSYQSNVTDDRVTFDFKFEKQTDVVGNSKLKLWVSSDEADDMDLFIAVQKLDHDKKPVSFNFFSTFSDGPAALGWLRVSHRELDLERSTAFQPWHKHEKSTPIRPGTIYPVEVEIWPTGVRFEPGETLRVIVQGNDVYRFNSGAPELGHATINRGKHVIHTGGKHDSHLLIPIVDERT
jgi:predicted acyl esterase